MKNYLLIVKNNFQTNLVYRFSTFAVFFGEIAVFLLYFYLWSSIYESGQRVGNYSFKEIISYYLVMNFLLMTVKNNYISWQIGDEIRLGQLNNNILKPFSYFGYVFSMSIGRLIYTLSVYMFLYVVLFFLLKNYIDTPQNAFIYFAFALSLILGYLINFLISYLIGLTAFWLGMIMGLNFSLWTTSFFLEGGVIPLDLLPSYIEKINNYLPFKYVIFVPISLFTNRINFNWELVVIPLLWIFALYFISKIIYKRGIKRYEGIGI